MNRAMFSAVAGLKTHQTRMDVIGNNIANVNTYGYKSQRAVFSDIFYQTIRGASQGTASRGGTNPSTIGYGSMLGAIQTQMTQSSLQNTGYGLDVAITGEGFLQVMDADGNIFYTKAGLIDYDANGYVVDINGNFVLGTADPNGAPNTQRIKLDNIGAVNPTSPSAEQKIYGVTYTLTASNNTKDGNVGVTITSSSALPIGQKATAVISNTGAITVTLNANEVFTSLDVLNSEINDAIRLANNNRDHAAGRFTLTMTDELGQDVSTDKFSATMVALVSGAAQPTFLGGALVSGVSPDFAGRGTLTFATSYVAGGDLDITITAQSGEVYTGSVLASDLPGPASCILSGAAGEGTIMMSIPALDSGSSLGAGWQTTLAAPASLNLGDQNYIISEGTGLTGGQIAVADRNVIPGKVGGFPVLNFGFKDTSNNFTGNGVVSDFSLTFRDAVNSPAGTTVADTWIISMTIGTETYIGEVPSTAVGSSVLMQSAAGGSYTLTIPTFDRMTELCRLYGVGAGSVATPSPPVNGATVDLIMDPPVDLAYPGRPGTEPAVATAAIPSANLGLSSVSFNLNGGKIGGLITLDELTAINIGADGTVSVSHADKGTISVGKISLANFANPRGLQQAGQNYYTYTVNSGPPVLADPGTGGTGALKANALEMSNVDLAQEFADMIVTQRGFQANTRIVSITDQMLEELVNLKR